MLDRAIVVVLFVALPASAFAYDDSVSVRLGFPSGICGGFEHGFNDIMGVRADVGVMLPGKMTMDVLAVVYLLPKESDFELDLLIGVPNAAAVFTLEGGMVTFGASLFAGYEILDDMIL